MDIFSQLGPELTAIGQLFLAALLGALIGIERSVAGKHAGMRTYALVALGACLFTAAGELIALRYAEFALDPGRIASAVVIGIGFIGTGLVVLQEHRPVGITTASGIWVAAGMGVAIAFSLYALAIAAAALTFLVFRVFAPIEESVERGLAAQNPQERE